jgi:F0F1-type ATP synthase assembly protein I
MIAKPERLSCAFENALPIARLVIASMLVGLVIIGWLIRRD